MSAVTILTSAAQPDSGNGSAVSVAAYSTLRLDWTVSADLGREPGLELFIDTAPTAAGPWRQIAEKKMDARHPASSPYFWEGKPRVVLSGFDAYVRARWTGRANNNTANGDTAMKLTLALTGDGKPD